MDRSPMREAFEFIAIIVLLLAAAAAAVLTRA
jgi:hypothetical protein